MLFRKRLINRMDVFDDMIADTNWRISALEKRIKALENGKRKPGRPRKNEADDVKKK